MEKAIVLLSGGQDSTTCLGWAKKRFGEVTALSLWYGQRHVAELDAAKIIAKRFGVEHLVMSVPTLRDIGGSALVDATLELKADGGLKDDQAPGGLPTSFVPGRNLLFLSIAAAVAVSREAKNIVVGVCQTDYSGYPDCREPFINSMEHTISLAMPSESGPIHIHTPLMHMSKSDTVMLANSLGEATWNALGDSITCYLGQRPGCGTCPACTLRVKGFAEAGFADPAHG